MTTLVVFTDLDGCLLDEATGAYEAARPALQALRRAFVPLVLCTSKTRAEVEPLHRQLGLEGPYVVENGGAIAIPASARGWKAPVAPRGGGPLVVPLGAPRARLVEALAEIAAEVGVSLRGFADLTVEEVAERTGLTMEDAGLATVREYDEPFLIEGGPPSVVEALAEAAGRRGLRVTSGGRFHHLTGPADKGRAVRQLLALHPGPVASVALGDSANDLTMLEAVDRPVLVPRPDGKVAEVLARALPSAERAPWPGPRGWNEAVLEVLR
jgi:mannosyl-3-phosphoglycerate phosphatase